MPDAVRVLHLRASNFVGGPERQILSYCASTSPGIRQSLAIFVGETEGRQFLERAQADKVETLALPVRTGAATRALIRHIREHKIDVICTHGYKADLIGLIAARRTKTKYFPFLRGWTAEDAKVRLYERLDRASLAFADRIVCLSQTHADKLAARGITATSLAVVRNACRFELSPTARVDARQALAIRYGIASSDIVVACAGRLSPEKGTKYFLQAAGELLTAVPNARFLVFGDGPLRSTLESFAQAEGVAERVTFTGLVTDFPALLPGIDLLVNPSLSEQAPNVVLEAMSAKVPCIATATGAVPEISGEAATLLLVPPGDSKVIVAAARRLLLDPAFADDMADRAYRRINDTYSAARQHHDLERLLLGSSTEESSLKLEIPGETPFLSIVMPVRNEGACIATILDSLLQQDYDPKRFEILVCDGLSDDRTPQIVADYETKTAGQVRLIPNPGRLSSAGRNCGVRASRGDVVIFVDGHCVLPSRSMLANVAGIYGSTMADVLCRPQPLSANLSSATQKAICKARSSTIGHGRDSTIFSLSNRAYVAPDSSGAIYRRDVFDRIGLYDESFDACEDVEFNVRCREAGLLAYTSPGVLVEYEARRTLGGLWKQMVRYGRGRARLYRKHPDCLSIAALAPALFLVLLAMSLALSVVSPYSLGLAALLVATYVVAVVASSAPIAVQEGPTIGALSALAFPCIHFGLGFGFLRELFASRKSGTPAGVPARKEAQGS